VSREAAGDVGIDSHSAQGYQYGVAAAHAAGTVRQLSGVLAAIHHATELSFRFSACWVYNPRAEKSHDNAVPTDHGTP
jgi:hypothetical protein